MYNASNSTEVSILKRLKPFCSFTIDFSCSGFIAGSCCARRQALWKRSKKAARSVDGSQAGTSQKRSEIKATFTMIITWTKKKIKVYSRQITFADIYVLCKMLAPTWTWKVRPRTKLFMLCLKLPWYLCNAAFICLKEEMCFNLKKNFLAARQYQPNLAKKKQTTCLSSSVVIVQLL